MSYKFKYRRWFLWRSVTVIGHRVDKELNRADLFLPDGSILSIPSWDKCELYLGTDWVLFSKKQMEKEARQPVTLNV